MTSFTSLFVTQDETTASHHKGRQRSKANCSSKILGVPKYLLWTFLAVAVIILVVPLAVMFGRKKSPPPSSVLVPLYVYPNPGAWDPLLAAITNHPTVNFTVVINPNSGPGDTPIPDGNYTRDIPRLNSYPNVQTVGYVSTNWTNRAISSALQDISTYAGWSKNSSVQGLGVQGIFLDEAPSVYTSAAVNFLNTIASAINFQPGFGNNPLIIQNPGTIPDPRFLPSCNLSVVFEGSYSTYQNSDLHKNITAFQKSSSLRRNATACIIHDLPSTLSSKDENSLVRELRGLAGSIFVTGLSVDYYGSFWDGWQGFVADVLK